MAETKPLANQEESIYITELVAIRILIAAPGQKPTFGYTKSKGSQLIQCGRSIAAVDQMYKISANNINS